MQDEVQRVLKYNGDTKGIHLWVAGGIAMETRSDFGDWVRYRRQALGLTQSELAKRISCSNAMIKKIESGQRRPSVQLVKLLARALRIPAADQVEFMMAARPDIPSDQ